MIDSEDLLAEKMRRRPRRVHVRFTLEEYGHLREQARITNQRPATLMRGLVLGLQLRPVPRLPEDVQRAVKSFGRNLNQLAHQANMGRVDQREVEALRKEITHLLRIIQR
ncbi:MAG: plasmid mobilization relaxosome protein MobC [Acidobacteriota bacterium]